MLKLKLSYKGMLMVSVPLAFELIFIGVLVMLLKEAETEAEKQARSKAIIAQSSVLSRLFYDAGMTMSGYSITKSVLFKDRYDKTVAQIPREFSQLESLVGNNTQQQETIKHIKDKTDEGL